MPQKYTKRNIYNKLVSLFSNIPNEKYTDFYGLNPNNILPDVFTNAKKAVVDKYTPLQIGDFGGYSPTTNKIEMTSQDMVNKYIKLLTENPAVIDYPTPSELKVDLQATLPHELGHAIYNKDLPHISDDTNESLRYTWHDIHSRNFKNNPALGDYQYKEDSSHSFADAYSLYASNPERLKNHFPEVYEFFKNLSGFEYKRPK